MSNNNANLKFNDWINSPQSVNLITEIIQNRLQKATLNFLLTNKLVISTFSPIKFISTRYSSGTLTDVKRFYRLIITNLGKRLPLLKTSNANYITPYLSYRVREVSLFLNCNSISMETLERY